MLANEPEHRQGGPCGDADEAIQKSLSGRSLNSSFALAITPSGNCRGPEAVSGKFAASTNQEICEIRFQRHFIIPKILRESRAWRFDTMPRNPKHFQSCSITKDHPIRSHSAVSGRRLGHQRGATVRTQDAGTLVIPLEFQCAWLSSCSWRIAFRTKARVRRTRVVRRVRQTLEELHHGFVILTWLSLDA